MQETKIIYEDADLFIIDKPPGLVVDRSETQKSGTLQEWLENRLGSQGHALERGGIVHRLDKDTSGLLLVAKTQRAYDVLQKQFKNRIVKKEYLALVHGYINEGGVVEAVISRNPRNREKFVVVPKSLGVVSETPRAAGIAFGDARPRWSLTEYEPIKLLSLSSEFVEKIFNDLNKIQMRKLEKMGYNNFTLLRCFPKTGRTHQIRVHLKYIGHPVVADKRYVGRKIYRLDCLWCPRQFLHAAKLGFYHPKSGKWMEIESELPEDLERSLKMLETRS